jgi:hypothetical protein
VRERISQNMCITLGIRNAILEYEAVDLFAIACGLERGILPNPATFQSLVVFVGLLTMAVLFAKVSTWLTNNETRLLGFVVSGGG